MVELLFTNINKYLGIWIFQEVTSVLRQLFTIARRSEAERKPFGPLEELYVNGELKNVLLYLCLLTTS